MKKNGKKIIIIIIAVLIVVGIFGGKIPNTRGNADLDGYDSIDEILEVMESGEELTEEEQQQMASDLQQLIEEKENANVEDKEEDKPIEEKKSLQDKFWGFVDELFDDAAVKMEEELMEMYEEHGAEYTELWAEQNGKKLLNKCIWRSLVERIVGK